ncbi:MAG TPA: MarR family transcriptional regulator [Lactobacillaceae bacterium]|jgi:DNA-binding MarR family transcriptional regulator
MTTTLDFEQLNESLVEVFDNVMWMEEAALRRSDFADISIKDMHTIAAISMYDEKSASQVASMMRLTPSAMTTAIDKLVDKGYVERRRSTTDRRVVRLGLTHKGRVVFRAHQGFHRDLSRHLLDDMSEQEATIVQKALANLRNYLTRLAL